MREGWAGYFDGEGLRYELMLPGLGGSWPALRWASLQIVTKECDSAHPPQRDFEREFAAAEGHDAQTGLKCPNAQCSSRHAGVGSDKTESSDAVAIPTARGTSKDTVFLLDPPYPRLQRRRRRERVRRGALLQGAQSLKGRFLISYGIRGKFPQPVKGSDFWSKRIRTSRSIAHIRGVGGSSVRTQLLVANYEPTTKALDGELLLDDWDGALGEGVDDVENRSRSARSAARFISTTTWFPSSQHQDDDARARRGATPPLRADRHVGELRQGAGRDAEARRRALLRARLRAHPRPRLRTPGSGGKWRPRADKQRETTNTLLQLPAPAASQQDFGGRRRARPRSAGGRHRRRGGRRLARAGRGRRVWSGSR